MRTAHVHKPGWTRIARRDTELYSVQIVGSGAWGRATLFSATKMVWLQPSTFTGSFWLSGGAEGELMVYLHCQNEYEAPNLTVNWREKDRHLV